MPSSEWHNGSLSGWLSSQRGGGGRNFIRHRATLTGEITRLAPTQGVDTQRFSARRNHCTRPRKGGTTSPLCDVRERQERGSRPELRRGERAEPFEIVEIASNRPKA
jgi:hypothetical protein